MNLSSLQDFLVLANQAGYATGNDRQWTKEKDGSTTITFESNAWRIHDNFFGGEPYGGRAVVFFEGKPVWIMVYYGWVVPGVKPDDIYPFLRQALARMPADHPYRGPKEYHQDTFSYLNQWKGSLQNFEGEELIKRDGKEVYRATYMGGLVDQQSGV